MKLVPRRKSTTPATQVVATHRPAGWKKGKKRAARQSDDEEEQQEEEASSEAGKEYDEDLAPLGVGPKTGAQGRKRPRMGFVPNAPRPGGPARLAQEKWSSRGPQNTSMTTNWCRPGLVGPHLIPKWKWPPPCKSWQTSEASLAMPFCSRFYLED